MKTIRLRASGYTWDCPECGCENYAGAAPEEVACEGCHARFAVSALVHRRAVRSEEQMSLFDPQGEPAQE